MKDLRSPKELDFLSILGVLRSEFWFRQYLFFTQTVYLETVNTEMRKAPCKSKHLLLKILSNHLSKWRDAPSSNADRWK